MPECLDCGRVLTPDDIGATRKLVNRASTAYRCVPCLAKRFGVSEALLRGKIEEWRSYGCTLFPPQKQDPKT